MCTLCARSRSPWRLSIDDEDEDEGEDEAQ
jgi:hypothetical protein